MKTTQHAFKWGLYDMKDHFWYGNDKGPNTYESYDMARAAATILTGMFNYKTHRRIRPRIIPPEVLHTTGKVECDFSAEESLKKWAHETNNTKDEADQQGS